MQDRCASQKNTMPGGTGLSFIGKKAKMNLGICFPIKKAENA